MSRYIIRRLLQAIPLLFFVSIILFVLMGQMGDPIATMGGRRVTRPADRERLTVWLKRALSAPSLDEILA